MSLRAGAPHLFLDLDGVASYANLSVTLGVVSKDYEAPIVAGEDPWDAFMAGYSSLLLAPVNGVPTYFLYYCCAALPGANHSQAGNYRVRGDHHGRAHLGQARAHCLPLGRRGAPHEPRLPHWGRR